jgi:hypothetical protein
VEETDAESAEEELEPDWLTVELDAPEYGADVELLSPLVRLELWLDVLLPLPAFVVVAEDGDAELTFPDPEAEDGATVLALAVPDAKVDVMELTLVEAAAFDTEVPRYDVSSVVVFDVGTLLSDGLVELDAPGLGAPDPRVDEDTADDDVVDVTVADGGLVDEAVDPISEPLESKLLRKPKLIQSNILNSLQELPELETSRSRIEESVH